MDKDLPTYDAPTYSPLQPVHEMSMPTAPPPATQVSTTMFVGGPLLPPVNYGPKSQNATCPNCRHMIHTRIRTKATSKTHLWGCLLCPCLCCCLPHCITSCVNTNHYCPNCDTFLGTYSS